MMKTWIGVLAALWLPAAVLAQADGTQFRQIALLTLQLRLEQGGGALLNGVLNQICQDTQLPETETRKRLLDLLSEFEAQRRTKGPEWRTIAALCKKQGAGGKGEKFLRQFADNMRSALRAPAGRKTGDYELKEMVAEAESSTKLMPDQGRDLLLQLLSLGSATTMPRLAGVPQKISLLVEVQPAPVEVVSADTGVPPLTSEIQAKLAAMPPLLLAALSAELPSSLRIDAVVTEVPAQSTPDYWLVVTLEGLRDSYNGGPLQEITLTTQLALLPMRTEVPVLQRPLLVKRYTSTGKVLDPLSREFCGEAAANIRRALDTYLSAR